MAVRAKVLKAAIATCVNENWLAPACVTLLSASRNLDGTTADLFIVADKLSQQGHNNVTAFAQRHGIAINVKTHLPLGFDGLNPHRYSAATFLRLCLPEIIPFTYARLLYLDSDVLAFENLQPLLGVDLQGKALGAVPEVKLAPRRGILTDLHRRKIGLPKQSDYFNAGVLLFDWQQICARQLLQKAKDKLLRGQNFPFFDQDALNLVFQDDWQALPLKWNVEQSAHCYLDVKPALRHFNHAAKPWDWPNIMSYAEAYKYYEQALANLALQRFMQNPKRGNPTLARIEYHFRKASLHQRRFLRRKYANLL